jgi:hypothetical protein
MDIITRRDIIEDIGRPGKDGARIIIKKQGVKVTTVVIAGRRHEGEFQY